MLRDPLAWAEIDLAAIRDNVQALRSLTAEGIKFCAVVKSNAYGHGLVPVAKAAVAAGADWLAVIELNEALLLRQEGITVPLIITGAVAESAWETMAEHQVRLLLTSHEQLAHAIDYHGPSLFVHLKVETGLGRLGFAPVDIAKVVRTIQENPSLKLEGTASHFASLEEQDIDYTNQQVQMFETATAQAGLGLLRHMAATAAIIQLPASHFDLVRAGIGIYGLWPSDGVQQAARILHPNLVLKPALSLRAKLVQTKVVSAGMTVGYGRTHHVTSDMKVGVVAIGYADGYDRGLSNRASVLLNGQRCPVIGRVAMNMCMIDCSAVTNAQLGDQVTLIGRDGEDVITADEVAGWADTINYEIVTRIPASLPRLYPGA